MAGARSIRVLAASASGSNRPMETPPSGRREPSGRSSFSRVPKLMDPVVPMKNEFHFLPENGKVN
jgi:hypothetical protein